MNENIANISREEAKLLEHLGDYTEEPFDIIESYFDGKHLERLVRHQIESYNHFVNYYGNTFQHGGISLEEILIPYIDLKPR